MNSEIIVIKQLPVIEEQLRSIRTSIETKINDALSLSCTEDTVKEVKQVRAGLNKELSELEQRRVEVKTAVMAPYLQFEGVYKENISDIYKSADAQLRDKIASVENGLKAEKEEAARAYFTEYRESLGLNFLEFKQVGLNITLSVSLKALKAQCKAFLDKVSEDFTAISSMERQGEILVEYRKTLNIAQAVGIVAERHRAIEAMRIQQEEAAARSAQQEQIEAAVETALRQEVAAAQITGPADENSPVETEKRLRVTFTVCGSMEQMKALKRFLKEGGYDYE